MKLRSWFTAAAVSVGILCASSPSAAQEPVPGLPDPLRPHGAQGLRRVPIVLQQRRLELERRQQAADSRRDDRPRRPPGPGRDHAHLGHDRRQRVRLAEAPAAARLLRRQPGAERRRADRRLLRGRPRLRGQGEVADDRRQLRRARAQQLLADAVPQVLPRHRDERGTAPRGQPLLPRRLGEAPVAAGAHALLPRAVPPDASRARRRQELRVPERDGQGPLRRNGPLRRAGGGRLVRRGRRLLLGRRRVEARRSRAPAARTTSTTRGASTSTTRRTTG